MCIQLMQRFLSPPCCHDLQCSADLLVCFATGKPCPVKWSFIRRLLAYWLVDCRAPLEVSGAKHARSIANTRKEHLRQVFAGRQSAIPVRDDRLWGMLRPPSKTWGASPTSLAPGSNPGRRTPKWAPDKHFLSSNDTRGPPKSILEAIFRAGMIPLSIPGSSKPLVAGGGRSSDRGDLGPKGTRGGGQLCRPEGHEHYDGLMLAVDTKRG